jgi:Niemann-Pick C1 protein
VLHLITLFFVSSLKRSIEDELSRESRTDVYTILLSYLLMFAYITLFLGHLRKFLTLLVSEEELF